MTTTDGLAPQTTADSPPEQLRRLILSHALARCVHVVAECGVADALDDDGATAFDLARQCGMDADALDRMLRLLATHGVFAGLNDSERS